MAFFSRVVLPLLLFIYIAIETYLKLNDSSLCDATGCKLAGELLKFNPLYLNYLGLFAVFSLTILGYLSLKNTLMKKVFFTVLYGAIAFEATILGYQYLVNPEPCIFCLGIFSSLLLIGLLSQTKNFILLATIALSIFIGLNTLAINKNKSYITADGLYLIQSNSCSHCKKVKKFFTEEKIDYTPISVREVNARSFLKFVDISSIPVAIIKNENTIQIIKGDKDIITHFSQEQEQKHVSKREETAQTQTNSSLDLTRDIFSATSEPGCAITITETPSCEDENRSQE
ncbi:MAG: hypothetical protein L3J43_00695 [Sulfurovum sp.]|nr:hypothetical protein [Sulfurovum sp.]